MRIVLLTLFACLVTNTGVALAQCPANLQTWNRDFDFSGGLDIAPSGNLYVADAAGHRIVVYDRAGAPLFSFGSLGSGAGLFLWPSDLVITTSGTLLVADNGNNRIQEFTLAGLYLGEWSTPVPVAIALDSDGNIYVTNNHVLGDSEPKVRKYTSTGSFITEWGGLGSGSGLFDNPRGIAISTSGIVYVSDGNLRLIQMFSDKGVFLGQWGSSGSEPGQFEFPHGLAFDGDGLLYVADEGNFRIQVFAEDGTYLWMWGNRGSDIGEFEVPRWIAVDASDNIYVSETGYNPRVQKFENPAGCASISTQQTTWGRMKQRY